MALLLAALLVCWIILLVGSLLIDFGGRTRRNRIPLTARMAMSVVLAVAALVLCRTEMAGTTLADYGLLVFLGMTFGLVGDLVMAKVIPTPNRVIFGMLAFGVGHLCYIAAFIGLGQGIDQSFAVGLAASWLVYSLVSALLWYTLIRQPARGRALNVGTLVYALLLASMGAAAMALALQDVRLLPLALGGLLFIASDMFVGSELMRGTSFRSIG
ncbi:MAG: hypothetical protein KDE20_15430, partial [Caldilineaceae bacterium]|nr:hypothetical protein [Caldilineaceae bacterium]